MFDLNNSFGDIESDEFGIFSNIDKTESIEEEYDLAIVHYTKLLELNPNSAVAYYSIANSYYMKGEFNLAFQNYSKAIEIDETNAGVYNDKGTDYAGMGADKEG